MAGEDSHKTLEKNKGKEGEMHKEDEAGEDSHKTL
jgi:hypothetical protein